MHLLWWLPRRYRPVIRKDRDAKAGESAKLAAFDFALNGSENGGYRPICLSSGRQVRGKEVAGVACVGCGAGGVHLTVSASQYEAQAAAVPLQPLQSNQQTRPALTNTQQRPNGIHPWHMQVSDYPVVVPRLDALHHVLVKEAAALAGYKAAAAVAKA